MTALSQIDFPAVESALAELQARPDDRAARAHLGNILSEATGLLVEIMGDRKQAIKNKVADFLRQDLTDEAMISRIANQVSAVSRRVGALQTALSQCQQCNNERPAKFLIASANLLIGLKTDEVLL